MWKVKIGKLARKQLDRIPEYIRIKFQAWVHAVEEAGLNDIRKKTGFHDEPLKGTRTGQRSIRLSRAYRVIYEESAEGSLRIVEVIEVNKHDY